MQKKIIVLAIAAAFSAPAFADTAVYGVVDAAVANISSAGTKSDTLAASGGLAGSRIGVKASEDLTSGLKAVVVLEYALDTQTSDGIGAARQEMLAVAGDFGTFATGYLQTTGYDFSRFDPTSGSLVSPLGNITSGAGAAGFMIGNQAALKRAPRALAYISPDMGGLSVAVNYTTDAAGGLGNLTVSDAAADTKTTAYLLSANYTAGPLAVAVVYANKSNPAVVGATPATTFAAVNDTETAIGASYDLGVAKLSATYQIFKGGNASDSNNVMSISAVAPVGPGALAVSYAKSTMTANKTAAMTTAGTDADASGMTVAWLQGLSKTTTMYAAYSAMNQGGGTHAYNVANTAANGAFSNGAFTRMVALGLNKKF